MRYQIHLVAEFKKGEEQFDPQRTYLLEWLRNFVVKTLGLNIVRLEIQRIETKGENDGSE